MAETVSCRGVAAESGIYILLNQEPFGSYNENAALLICFRAADTGTNNKSSRIHSLIASGTILFHLTLMKDAFETSYSVSDINTNPTISN